MTIKEAKKLDVGNKVTIKDYRGEHEIISMQYMGEEQIGIWLDNGDLVSHKRIEKIIR